MALVSHTRKNRLCRCAEAQVEPQNSSKYLQHRKRVPANAYFCLARADNTERRRRREKWNKKRKSSHRFQCEMKVNVEA